MPARRKHAGIPVILIAVLAASILSHSLAGWIGISSGLATYRRIGPRMGPQVFCAGSSLMQFGLSWPEVSEMLGQGIENWGVGGSTPEVWEVPQELATNTNLTLIGVSVYDLNEHRLCDTRADIVPFLRTVRDLRNSRASWQFSKRLISQYLLAYLRKLFPTAGRSDAVLVGLRREARKLLRLSSASEDRAAALVLPSQAILDFGESTLKLSDLSKGRLVRRLATLRSEMQGMHSFDGPKSLALKRMVDHAQKQGRVVVVVLPVSPAYAGEFINPSVAQEFDNVLKEALRVAPSAKVVRLDKLPVLQSNDLFSDLVHLNSAGRRKATEAFLEEFQGSSTVR